MPVLRALAALACSAGFVAGAAGAATISVTLASDNSTCFNNIDAVCSSNGSGTFDDWGSSWSTAGGTSANVVGAGSTSTTFRIDAVTASDDGGADVGQSNDRQSTAALNFTLTVAIDVLGPNAAWSVDLAQSILGLYGFRGDGTLTAVGNQDDGTAAIGPFTVLVNGNPFNFSAVASSSTTDCANTCQSSTQFTGGRSDLGVLSGMGDATFNVTIDFDLSALSNDGCTGFICSSASGGEEAAVLFGRENVMDQAVDDYATWSRTIAPDGYNSTWTLNNLPEPTAGALLGLGGAAGIAWVGRRRAR